MVTLEEAKLYLRVDNNDEDNLIKNLIEFSKEEIKNSTGMCFNPDGNSYSYKLAQLIIVTDRYENRGSQDLTIKINNFLSNLYLKLRYEVQNENTSK